PLEKVRTCLRWIRENEAAVRGHLTAEVFEWWQDTYGGSAAAARSPEEFRERLTLACIYFYEILCGTAKVVFDCGERIMLVTVEPDGAFRPGADVFDRESLSESGLLRGR